MSYRALISPEGLRADGRRPHEIRTISCKMGVSPEPDGSCLLQQGHTKVMAAVYGPRHAKSRQDTFHDKALVTVEYELSTFATSQRRRGGRGGQNARDTALLLKQTLEAVIFTHLYPRSQISIFIQVLQGDGSELCCALNAASLALVDAGVPMKDFVLACSATWAGGAETGKSIVDVNYQEQGGGNALVQVAIMPNTGKVAMMHMERRVSVQHVDMLTEFAKKGCMGVYESVKDIVKDHAMSIIQARGSEGQ